MRQQLSLTEKKRLTNYVVTQLESLNVQTLALMYRDMTYCAKLKRACLAECVHTLHKEYAKLSQTHVNLVCGNKLRNHTNRIAHSNSLVALLVSLQIVIYFCK